MDEQKKEEKATEETDNVNEAKPETVEKPKRVGLFEDKTPQVLHCRRCRTEMKDGVCPSCGFRMYVPMDENKQKTVRLVLGGICLVAFVVLVLLMK